MNAPRTLALLLMALAIAGCRGGGGGKTDLVERELRTQEDRIYQLQEYIEQYQAMLESSRRENAALKRELGVQDDVAAPPTSGGSSGSSERAPRRSPQRRSGSGRNGSAPPAGTEFRPPVIELGEPTGSGSTPTPMPEEDSLPLPFGSPGPEDSSGVLDAGPVSKLVLNPRLTGGLNMDGQPGDEGVMVVIEPRTASGELTKTIGDVSIMVLDPSQDGAASRIARWDFTSDEAAQSWKKTIVGQGMQFELPWPDAAPQADRLRIYARLVTPQGEKFIAEKDIDVDIAGLATHKRAAAQWSPSKRAAATNKPAETTVEPIASKSQKRAASQWQLRPLANPTLAARQREIAERQAAALEPADDSADTPANASSVKPGRNGDSKRTATGRPEWKPYR